MQNKFQVSKFETCSYLRYKGIYATRKVSGRSRNGPLVTYGARKAPLAVKSWSIFICFYIRKGKITAKFQSLKRVLIEDTKGFVTQKVSERSRNGPLISSSFHGRTLFPRGRRQSKTFYETKKNELERMTVFLFLLLFLHVFFFVIFFLAVTTF